MMISSIRRRLLIFNPIQFGYHTDTYSYCKYLNKDLFEVTYLCYDQKHPKVNLESVEVYYFSIGGNRFKRQIKMLFYLKEIISNKQIDIIFQVHVRYALLYRIFNLSKRFILDIRTGYLSRSSLSLALNNLSIRIATIFYPRITIISESLKERLLLHSPKTQILPLGSEVRQAGVKSFETIHLLYVGTLNGREIEKTIYGFSIFRKRNPFIEITYDIVGFGYKKEEEKVITAISSCYLEKEVKFHGMIPYWDIDEFFYNCNVGIIYIPITKGYNCQPTTKLFECLLAGMPVIATSTFENTRFVNTINGILIKDTPESFVAGLEELITRAKTYNSEKIRESVKDFSWEHIVDKILTPILNS